VGQLHGCNHASGVRVMYRVCSKLRYKVIGPTVRREDLKSKSQEPESNESSLKESSCFSSVIIYRLGLAKVARPKASS